MNQSSTHKANMETLVLNDTLVQIDLIDIYRTAEYTFFSNAHETVSRIDHMLDHKTILSKFKKNKIISNIFSHHNGIKLEISYSKKTENKMWRLNNILLNNHLVNKKIKERLRKYIEKNKNGNTIFQNLWYTTKAVLK